MPAIRLRLRAITTAVAVFALVALASGAAVAASNPATLYACFDAYGNVRMSDVPQCRLPGGGRLVSWSTVAIPGPTGATGITGATGPTGPTGAQGDPGPAGSGEVTQRFTAPRDGSFHLVATGSGFRFLLACEPTTQTARVEVPDGAVEGVTGARMWYDDFTGTWGQSPLVVPVGSGSQFTWDDYLDVQVGSSVAGGRMTVQWSGTDGDQCVLLVTTST